MPPNTALFVIGLGLGIGLLVIGLVIGFWFGRRAAPTVVDRKQFLAFLRNLSMWTTEFAGDVSEYQLKLGNLNSLVQAKNSVSPEEIGELLRKIMDANNQLQSRLESAEALLETQTSQISQYLTEALTDGLTGLFNRRAFDRNTDELFSHWQSKSKLFSLGLLDIDHFKNINDVHGHPAGDAVLKRVAEVLQSEFRDASCVARYGGEEFAVLSYCPVDEMAAALEQLRVAMTKMEVDYEGQTIVVTVSAGAAVIAPDDKIGKLVRRADEALYAAKMGGRNRVYLHDGTVCQLVTRSEAPIAGNRERTVAEQSSGFEQEELQNAQSRIQQRLNAFVQEESRRILRS